MMTEIGLAGAGVAAASKIKEDSLIGLIYKDLAQPSVQAVGKALGHTFDFATIPFQVMKFGTDVAKLNLKKRLDSYEEKLNKIPEDQRIEVNPQVGVPILERLTYTTNDDIAELFTNLLKKASSSDTVNQAHPAFIQVIDRLSMDEAKILAHLHGKSFVPCISFQVYIKSATGENLGYYDHLSNATSIQFDIDLLFPGSTPFYLDNLVSLGILKYPDGVFNNNEAVYANLMIQHEYERVLNEYRQTYDFNRLNVLKSRFDITNFGRVFIEACTS